MSNPLAFLGTAVRCVVNGVVDTVHIDNYDSSNDTYIGICFTEEKSIIKTFLNAGKGALGAGPDVVISLPLKVKGLRRYPFAARPNADFQYVLPGEDEQPLIDIATANSSRPTTPSGGDGSESGGTNN